jgi:hypothetical protein
MKLNKPYCKACGFVPYADCQMDVHHEDHNHANNHPDNLSILCANCHRLMHANPDKVDQSDRYEALIVKVLRAEKELRERRAAWFPMI